MGGKYKGRVLCRGGATGHIEECSDQNEPSNDRKSY